MQFSSAVITGGAGFVGSTLAISLRARWPHLKVTALDNLKRRGSELTLTRLRAAGISFQHADVRCSEDLETLADFDLLIDCSAEPSVHAGQSGNDARIVLTTNLSGTANCLEIARRRKAAFLFLSTSRVYPIGLLNSLPFEETASRYELAPSAQSIPGYSERGVSEQFPLNGARSLYGASKLASELLIQEYVFSYGMRAIINRCGVLAGPWQMGKVDQGVVTLWVSNHLFQRPLRYIGYGGTGKQVRDVLHVDDLFGLVSAQLERTDLWDGRVYNVGGGRPISTSLLELTNLCRDVTGNSVPITPVPQTASVDVRMYLTDSSVVQRDFQWQPKSSIRDIVSDIAHWIRENKDALSQILG